jgi:hypothetical protein
LCRNGHRIHAENLYAPSIGDDSKNGA